jgi:hypothetical protein
MQGRWFSQPVRLNSEAEDGISFKTYATFSISTLSKYPRTWLALTVNHCKRQNQLRTTQHLTHSYDILVLRFPERDSKPWFHSFSFPKCYVRTTRMSLYRVFQNLRTIDFTQSLCACSLSIDLEGMYMWWPPRSPDRKAFTFGTICKQGVCCESMQCFSCGVVTHLMIFSCRNFCAVAARVIDENTERTL